MAGAPAGGLAWLLWIYRKPVAAYAWMGIGQATLVLASILVMLMIGGSVIHLIAGQGSLDRPSAQVIQTAFDLLPLGLAVIAAVGASLLAMRPTAPHQPQLLHRSAQWLALPEHPALRIKQDDVTTVRAAGNYCEILGGPRVHLIRATIKLMTTRLAPLGFVRVHRSALVNLDHLRSVEGDGGRVVACLDDGSLVPVGKAFRAALESALSARSSLQREIGP